MLLLQVAKVKEKEVIMQKNIFRRYLFIKFQKPSVIYLIFSKVKLIDFYLKWTAKA